MPDASIAITAKDNFSDALTKIAQKITPLSKDLSGLQGDLDTFNATKVSLKVDLSVAKRELNAAKKAFEDMGDAASRAEYEAAQAKYDQLQGSLQLVSKKARQAENDMQTMAGTASKVENKMGGSAPGNSDGGIGTGLARSGVGQLLSGAVSQAAGTLVQSAFGQPTASAISSLASGAISGAAMGSIAGPLGALIGGGVGAAAGAIQGGLQIFQAQDDAFKAYVQEQTETRLAEQKDTVSSGSAIAAQRETDLISFSTLFQSQDVAEQYLGDLKTMANTTPFLYDDLTAMSKTLKTFGYATEDMIPTLTAIGDTGAALGMNTSDMNAVSQTIGRMKNTSKLTRETMDMLRDRGIDAYGYLAESKGISKEKLDEQISKGEISGEYAAQAIIDAMVRNFGGSMQLQSKTFSGLSSTLQGMEQEQQAAAGEGFNGLRSAGLEKQIEWYGGEGGTKMEEVNRALGAFSASLENSKEGYIRGAMDVMMASDEFVEAQKTANDPEASTEEQQAAWAKMGEILASAKTQGLDQYNASEGAHIALESDMALAGRIRDDAGSNQAYWDAGYRKGEEYSKGLAERIQKINVNAMANGGKDLTQEEVYYLTGELQPHAAGLPRVPYDNYPALLHQGERVLTAREARQQDAGSAGNVIVTGNSFTVREEADIGKVAQELARLITLGKAARAPQ